MYKVYISTPGVKNSCCSPISRKGSQAEKEILPISNRKNRFGNGQAGSEGEWKSFIIFLFAEKTERAVGGPEETVGHCWGGLGQAVQEKASKGKSEENHHQFRLSRGKY